MILGSREGVRQLLKRRFLSSASCTTFRFWGRFTKRRTLIGYSLRSLPCDCTLQTPGLVGDHLAEDFVEANGDFPIRIVGLELGEV